MRKTAVTLLYLWALTVPVQGALVYQDFEADNGTLPPYGSPAGTAAEYGWGFGRAATGLNDDHDPVHGGSRSWKVTLPAGKPLQAGTGIPAQFEAFNVNFVPECHDRLTFWIWSDPSQAGDHTVMVKFFDQGAYKEQGVSVWTAEQAAYRQWTSLSVPFSQLPSDFNWHRVDKIEFLNYWDGTYYYDDIVVASTSSPGQDLECLTARMYISCRDGLDSPPAASSGKPVRSSVILGVPAGDVRRCHSVFDQDVALALDVWQTREERRLAGAEVIRRNEPR